MARITDTGGFAGGAATIPALNTSTMETDFYVPPKKPKKPKGNESSGSTATVTKAPPKNKPDKKKPEKQKPEPYNPFYAPFKTPNELRAEAARLAALGATPETILRTQQAEEERGITGLTTALANRLSGFSNEYLAGLRGLQAGYRGVAEGAQAAGQAAVAAAGAPTSGVAGALPTEAAFAALGAVPATYAPAATLTGTRLVASSRQALTKALAERAARISGDTAKYLQQLQDRELQRAISQTTAEQNAARLSLSGQTEAWNQKMDVAKLNLSQQRVAMQLQRDLAKEGKAGAKKIQSAKDKILTNLDKWTGASVPTGQYEFTIYYTDASGEMKRVPKTVRAANQEQAASLAKSMVPSVSVDSIQTEQGNAVLGSPTQQQVLSTLVPILVNAGMTRANARKWVLANVRVASVV